MSEVEVDNTSKTRLVTYTIRTSARVSSDEWYTRVVKNVQWEHGGKNPKSTCMDWRSFKGEVTLAPGLEG